MQNPANLPRPNLRHLTDEKIQKVQQEVDDVRVICVNLIEKALDRTEKIERLTDKAEVLTQDAINFQKKTRKPSFFDCCRKQEKPVHVDHGPKQKKQCCLMKLFCCCRRKKKQEIEQGYYYRPLENPVQHETFAAENKSIQEQTMEAPKRRCVIA